MSRYSTQTKSMSPSVAIEESKKKTTLLKDNSWIRRDEEEDEPVDRDPNFGKSVLSRYRSSETLLSSEPEETKTTKPISNSTSVQALTKRFSTSQDELRSSTLPSTRTSSYTKSSYSSLKSDSPTTTTTTTTYKTTTTEEPKTSTKTTTTINKDGSTTETTITTSQSLRSPVTKTPTKTETFTERVRSSSKEPLYSTYSPTRTTKVTEKNVISTEDAEDKLYDTLTPPTIKDDSPSKESKTTTSTTETVTVKSSSDSHAEDQLYNTLIPWSVKGDTPNSKTTVSSTETVTVKSSINGDVKTTTTTRTSSTAEDELYDTLLPKAISCDLSSPVRGESPTVTSPTSTRTMTSYTSYSEDTPSTTRTTSYTISTKPSDYSSERRSYSYSRPDSSYEYSSITSPTTYTTTSYRSSSRSDDILSDPIYSKSSIKSVYASPDRPVLEKDLCTVCRKPFTGDAKMVLEDMKINCHASCFKCDVCNSTLGNLKAGDSMWIYKHMVHCDNCFEVTREKWRR